MNKQEQIALIQSFFDKCKNLSRNLILTDRWQDFEKVDPTLFLTACFQAQLRHQRLLPPNFELQLHRLGDLTPEGEAVVVPKEKPTGPMRYHKGYA